ncbi:MAG TPA: translation elongation factor Ts [Candidatus Peribacteraceae bacterium]|nr:translation elongation factor Ts [Candidatus Peribacteraceae bacterium]
MTQVTASAVASLRARTGVGMMECKQALEESGGDEEKAIEWLRKRGTAHAVKKAGREQGEGYVFTAEGKGKLAIVLIRCETDFVARSDDFQKFGQEIAELLLKEGEAGGKKAAEPKVTAAVQQLGENISLGETRVIEAPVIGSYVHSNGKIGVVVALDSGSAETAKDVAMHAAAMNPLYVTPDDVPAGDVAKEKEIWKSQLAKEGKPEAIMEKIMMGKEKKFKEENALTTQQFVKNPEQKVGQLLGKGKITEYVRLSVR